MEKKNYEVSLYVGITVAVEGAESEEQAEQIARDAAEPRVGEITDIQVYPQESKEHWERTVRHAAIKTEGGE